jgi:glycosyltransferase involved in cell wall biosynthesis
VLGCCYCRRVSPHVTVVIPTHTGGPYVREAVASVRAQTFDDWEIKIVCDGCDDEMSDLKPDPRLEVIYQKQSGVAIARNVGYRASAGRLITFLDHDDIMHPEKLGAQVAMFDQDPAIGLCHTQFEQVDVERRFLVAGHGADIQYDDVLQCRFSMLISTALVSREAMESVGGFDPKSQAEDIDFVLKVSRAFPLGFVPQVLLQYRRHGVNVSGDPWVQFREVDYVLRGYRRYLQSIGELDSLALLDRGRVNNRRTNAEIAILRARAVDQFDAAGVGTIAKNVALALCLSPPVVKANARAFFASRRG